MFFQSDSCGLFATSVYWNVPSDASNAVMAIPACAPASASLIGSPPAPRARISDTSDPCRISTDCRPPTPSTANGLPEVSSTGAAVFVAETVIVKIFSTD